MDSLLVTVATYSGIAVWVFGLLFAIDLVTLMIYVSRSGNVEPEEGHVVTENRALTANDSIAMGGTGAPGGRYWGKHKVLFSRSAYISDTSLVDGTATKAQRLLVHGIQLGAVLFWLAFVCGALTLLSSQPVVGLLLVIGITFWFFASVKSVLKGRADARRKLKERQARKAGRKHENQVEGSAGGVE